jgi:hypothetical protein
VARTVKPVAAQLIAQNVPVSTRVHKGGVASPVFTLTPSRSHVRIVLPIAIAASIMLIQPIAETVLRAIIIPTMTAAWSATTSMQQQRPASLARPIVRFAQA